MFATTAAIGQTQKVEKIFTAASSGTLVLDSDRGSIKVETWDQKAVEILVFKKASTQNRLDNFEVTFEQNGRIIEVEGDGGSRVSVEYEIRVPKEFDLDLKTGGGSISIGDIKGDVKVKTSGGSIKTGNVDGDVDVDTSGGSIKLGNITGKSKIDTSGGSITVKQGGIELNAETSGGSINIGPSMGDVDVDTSGGSIKIGASKGKIKAHTSGGSITVAGSSESIDINTSGGSLTVASSGGPVKAKTSGGNIKIKQVKGSIEARTSGGKIEAEMILADNSADTHINLRSSGGSITLYIPKNLAASISASLEITRSANRDYNIYSDFPLDIKGEDDITGKGDINGGGDRIILDTVNGDIHIRYLQ